MFKKAAVLVVSCGALLSGCGTDLQTENQEIVSNLVEAGFRADDIMIVDGAVYVGLDAQVSLEASREMLQHPKGSEEQYRTTNLVGTGVTKICVVPTSQFNSYPNLSAGLDLAIDNYNSQGLRLTFVRGSFSDCTATINAKTTTGAGGSSGFPSGGKPYGTINIGTGTDSYGADVCEHVITHEIGHTIGFRHSDYYDRSISCGGAATNEGASTVGAILIPGTPSTAKVGGSIMNSCFRANETGEWTSSDKTALKYLYP
ncbi:MAG: M57 family metalloprotease [Isosphaeraceae bacterium]